MSSPLPLLLTIAALALAGCTACDSSRLDAAPRLVTATLPSVGTTIAVAATSAGPGHTVAPRASRSRPVVVRRPAAGPTGDLSTLLDRLAMCESGGNPRASGRFHGAFQFMLSTWRSLGGVGMPEDQGYEYQKSIAAKIPVSAWHSQFPACSRRIGV